MGGPLIRRYSNWVKADGCVHHEFHVNKQNIEIKAVLIGGTLINWHYVFQCFNTKGISMDLFYKLSRLNYV